MMVKLPLSAFTLWSARCGTIFSNYVSQCVTVAVPGGAFYGGMVYSSFCCRTSTDIGLLICYGDCIASRFLAPIAYMSHLSKMCVVPTLCNMWRHMEAVYGWDPAMYSALKSISLRLAQLVDNYASGSDTEVVPLLIEYTLDQVSSIFLSANIEDTRYVPPAGASHFTTMPVESLDDIVAALNLVPYIAPCGHMASKLMRIMTNHSSPTITTSTVDPLVEGGPHKRSRHGEGRLQGGGSVRRDPKTVGYCRHFMTTEGCNRQSCRYPHLAALPPTADRAFLAVWASGFGLTLRPHL